MKSAACQMSLILLSAFAAPSVLAGPDILKCVDSGGHVTLTDQPCPAGTRVTLVIPDATPPRPAARGAAQMGGSGAGSTGSGGDEPQVTAPAATAPAPAVERMPAPPAAPRSKSKTPAGKHVPLSRDETTLRAAHMRMLINDDQMGRQAAQ